MALVINTNLAAMNTHRQLGATDWRLSRSLEKLSSGLRINRASDDAAGLSISEVLRTQVRGNLQAGRNVMDAISLLNVADAGMEQIHTHLQRMRELAVQAAHGTYTDEDRAGIDAEFQELMDGINAIAVNTDYNGLALFQGMGGTMTNENRSSLTVASTTSSETVQVRNTGFIPVGSLSAGTTTPPLAFTAANYNLGVTGASSMIVEIRDSGGVTRTLGAGEYTYNAGTNTVTMIGSGVPAPTDASVRVRYIDAATLTDTLPSTVIAGSEAVSRGGGVGSVGGNYTYDPVAGTVALTGASRPWAGASAASRTFTTTYTETGNTTIALDTSNPFTGGAILNTLTVTGVPGGNLTQGVDFTLSQNLAARIGPTSLYTYSITIPNSVIAGFGTGAKSISLAYNIDYPLSVDPLQVEFQIGANNGMTQNVVINPCSLGAMGLSTTAVDTQANAQAAITAIDNAIQYISNNRGELGASINQMQGYYNNTTNQALQMSRAYTQIRDTDMADQMTDLTKQQILSVSTMNMLSISNANPQHILKLLSA